MGKYMKKWKIASGYVLVMDVSSYSSWGVCTKARTLAPEASESIVVLLIEPGCFLLLLWSLDPKSPPWEGRHRHQEAHAVAKEPKRSIAERALKWTIATWLWIHRWMRRRGIFWVNCEGSWSKWECWFCWGFLQRKCVGGGRDSNVNGHSFCPSKPSHCRWEG